MSLEVTAKVFQHATAFSPEMHTSCSDLCATSSQRLELNWVASNLIMSGAIACCAAGRQLCEIIMISHDVHKTAMSLASLAIGVIRMSQALAIAEHS